MFVMGHMSLNHVYRQIENAPDKVDITGNSLQSKQVKTIVDILLCRGTNGAGHESKVICRCILDAVVLTSAAYGLLLECT